jgi:hypothetical protein
MDRRGAHAEEGRDLPHGEELANRPKGVVVRRWAVQSRRERVALEERLEAGSVHPRTLRAAIEPQPPPDDDGR